SPPVLDGAEAPAELAASFAELLEHALVVGGEVPHLVDAAIFAPEDEADDGGVDAVEGLALGPVDDVRQRVVAEAEAAPDRRVHGVIADGELDRRHQVEAARPD